MSDVQKFDNLVKRVDRIVTDFKLELNQRDKKIGLLEVEINELHKRLTIHWEANPEMSKVVIDRRIKENG